MSRLRRPNTCLPSDDRTAPRTSAKRRRCTWPCSRSKGAEQQRPEELRCPPNPRRLMLAAHTGSIVAARESCLGLFSDHIGRQARTRVTAPIGPRVARPRERAHTDSSRRARGVRLLHDERLAAKRPTRPSARRHPRLPPVPGPAVAARNHARDLRGIAETSRALHLRHITASGVYM